MVRVKICGMTRGEDALFAVDAGATALGFIFVPGSPRRVTLESARSIIRSLPPMVTPVGVFVDAARAVITETIERTGIQCLQLHGDETPEETEGYPVPVIKSFRVGADFDPGRLSAYPVHACLLDTHVEGIRGGTGRTFNWDIAVRAREYSRIIVSGGISAENVGEAIRRVRPYAIDVSSGVESSPGIKDRGKIGLLMEAVRRSDPPSHP